MEAYNSKFASRIVGVTLRQIQYWDEQGFVRPSVKVARGRGSKRIYSFHDLICLKVVKDLTHYGFSLHKIRRCVRQLRRYSPDARHPIESLKYVTDGKDLFVITSDREKILTAMDRQFVVSLGIGKLVRKLTGEVRRATSRTATKRSPGLRQLAEKTSGSA
jgi:DNA-binding transcriptional MerR regulator